MSLRILSLLLLCCCLLAAPARALDPGKAFHHYVRDTWSVQEGMPQISVAAIAQTPDGYLWVGTQAGLTRFDGVGFTTFTPADEPAIPHPTIVALAVDDHGALWIGTRAGLTVRRDGRFHQVPWAGTGEPPQVNNLLVAVDGRVWAATLAGVAYVDDDLLQPLPGYGAAQAIAIERNGTLWVAGGEGVRQWDGRAWMPGGWPDEVPSTISSMIEVEGAIWAATSRGFYIHGPSGWRPMEDGPDAGAQRLAFAYRDSEGNVWGGGARGLVRVRPDGTLDTIPATPANGLSNMVAAFEDREGNLWLGSLSDGLHRLRNGWTRRYSTQEGLGEPTVWSVAPDAGGNGVWVGTGDGLAHLGNDGRFSSRATAAGIVGPVSSVYSEPGRLWVGVGGGLVLYEPDSGLPATKPEWARDMPLTALGFLRDSEGNLWIAARDGLMRWDGVALERFDDTRGLVGTLAEFRPVTLRDGRVLVATRSGLFEFDGHGFRPAPDGAGLPDNIVLELLVELSDGRLLVADMHGLLLRHRDRWHRVGPEAGLVPGDIYQVVERDGVLWVSTANGVYGQRVDELTALVERRVARINPDVLVDERGLPNTGQHDVCCSGGGLHDGFIAGDTFWLPTRDGVLAVDFGEVAHNPDPPDVLLGRVQVGGQWRMLGSGASDTPLAADERDLAIAFDVLSFQDPRSNQVRYRLTGYDWEWQDAAPMVREVRYTNLPPGDYAFEVLASNNSGVWTAQPARLEFSISPYFHETLASRLLLAMMVGLLGYAGYRYQRHRHRLRQAELERLVDQRTEALAESNRQLADSNRQLEQASLTDPLTGLRNRRYLTQQIPADLNYYDRQLTAPPEDTVVFAMLDLDHFKQVNDVYGHAIGDRVLEEAARRLKDLVRSGDYVVRWGGEEFLLVFRPMPASHVPGMGERLRGTMAASAFDIGEGRSIQLTASVGLSEYPLFRHGGQPLNWEAMIELADQAAYHVKRNGRNGWALFRPTDATRMDTLLADLQQAADALLQAGELALVSSMLRPGTAPDSRSPALSR